MRDPDLINVEKVYYATGGGVYMYNVGLDACASGSNLVLRPVGRGKFGVSRQD